MPAEWSFKRYATALLISGSVSIMLPGCVNGRSVSFFNSDSDRSDDRVIDIYRPEVPVVDEPTASTAQNEAIDFAGSSSQPCEVLPVSAEEYGDRVSVQRTYSRSSEISDGLEVRRTGWDESEAGESAPADPITIDVLEHIASENNPTLRQLAASIQKARTLRAQVGLKPNPVLGYSGGQLFDHSTDQHVAFVEQEFVTGGKLCLNQRVLDQSVQMQWWELETQRQRVLTDVRVQFYQALAAQRRIELTDSFHTVVERGVDVTRQRLKALEASQVDVLQAEIQLTEIDLKRQQARIGFDAAWRELVALTGLPQLAPTTVAGDLAPRSLELDWDQTYLSLLAASPELNVARMKVQEARANQRRQEAQAIPNPTVLVGAGQDNGTNTGMLNVQIGIPVPVHNKNHGNISAAYADYCRATHDVKRIEASLKARLAQVAREFDSAAATVRLYEETILPKAEETLRLSEQAYSAGEFDFLQVLIVRRTFFESSLIHVQALGDLAQAQARLDGVLLTGGLNEPADFTGDDALRGQTFSQQ